MMGRIKKIIVERGLVIEVVVAFLLTVCMMQLFGDTNSRKYFLMTLIFIAIFTTIHYGVQNYSKRRLKFSLFYAIPFSFAFWLGQKVVYQSTDLNNFTIKDIPILLALTVVNTLVSIYMLSFIDKKMYIPKRKGDVKKWSNVWVFALIILLCWLPVFLSLFPGVVSNDSAVQLRQAVGESGWSNWHPVLHTLFMAFSVNIGMNMFGGDLTAGIAFSTILQMLILSVIFGYVVKWVINLTQKKWVGYLLLIFFAFCPIVACYSVTMWKDVLFSAVFLLLFVNVYDLIRAKGREEQIKIRDLWSVLLLTLLTGFLRNGGIIIIATLMIAMLAYYRTSWKAVFGGFGTLLVITVFVQGLVYRMFNIKSSPMMESLSVPAQQFGYIAGSGKLDEGTRKELAKYADVDCLAEYYSPMNADPAKNCFNYEAVDENKWGFLMLWVRTLPGHVADYVKSYILHTYSYWYIQGNVWALDFGHSHDEMWLKMEYNDLPLAGEDLKDFVIEVEEGATVAVWTGWMNNVGVMFWGILYMLMVFMYQKRYAVLVPMSGVLIYMISLLIASPISWMFRYVYSLLLVLPILIVICFVKNKNMKGDNK